jgi:hypothetical protein
MVPGKFPYIYRTRGLALFTFILGCVAVLIALTLAVMAIILQEDTSTIVLGVLMVLATAFVTFLAGASLIGQRRDATGMDPSNR